MVTRSWSCKCTEVVFLISSFQLGFLVSVFHSINTKHSFLVSFFHGQGYKCKNDMVSCPEWIHLPAHMDLIWQVPQDILENSIFVIATIPKHGRSTNQCNILFSFSMDWTARVLGLVWKQPQITDIMGGWCWHLSVYLTMALVLITHIKWSKLCIWKEIQLLFLNWMWGESEAV